MDTRSTTTDEDALRERANELYWESDESVNQIAEDMELSKGRLYNLVEPLASGLPCPRCSEEMEYPNRTARDKGFLTCPGCDLEENADDVQSEWKEAARQSDAGTVVVKPGDGPAARTPPRFRDHAGDRRVVLGTAFLGAAAAVAVALWARRK